MKRLIRKASLDVGQFIDQWIKQPNTCPQLRDTVIYMINENMDCVYQGEAYKFLEIPTKDITASY